MLVMYGKQEYSRRTMDAKALKYHAALLSPATILI